MILPQGYPLFVAGHTHPDGYPHRVFGIQPFRVVGWVINPSQMDANPDPLTEIGVIDGDVCLNYAETAEAVLTEAKARWARERVML